MREQERKQKNNNHPHSRAGGNLPVMGAGIARTALVESGNGNQKTALKIRKTGGNRV